LNDLTVTVLPRSYWASIMKVEFRNYIMKKIKLY